MNDAAEVYFRRAEESLLGAKSELAHDRYNNCANRCYYACFQAAISALLAASIRSTSPTGQWGHDFVQARSIDPTAPAVQDAIGEMQELILSKFPEASFHIEMGDDPVSVHLVATVDIDDTDEVVDCYVDRLVDLQVEEGLPLHVIVVRPIERTLALLRGSGPHH